MASMRTFQRNVKKRLITYLSNNAVAVNVNSEANLLDHNTFTSFQSDADKNEGNFQLFIYLLYKDQLIDFRKGKYA